MSRRPLLGVVHPETGEVVQCPQCQHREDVIVQLEKENRLHKAKITKLERDIEVDAHKDSLWFEVEGIFDWYRLAVWKPRLSLDAEFFYLAKPHMKRVGPIECLKAICGAAYDPYVSTLKNGNEKRHDSWGLIFQSKGKFESFVERVPGKGEQWKIWLLQRIEESLR